MMSQSHRSGYQVNSDLAALYNVHYLMHQSPQLRAVARHETHHAVCVTRSTRQSDVYCKDVQTDLYSNTLQYATDKTPGHNPLNRNPLSRYAGRLELGPRLVGRTESGVRVRASFPQIPHRVLCCGSIKGRGLEPRGVLSGRVDLIPWSACMSVQ